MLIKLRQPWLKGNLASTQTRVQELRTKNKNLEKQISTINSKIANLEQCNADNKKKILELLERHDDLEQYTRKFNVEIYGLPEQESEYPAQLVLNLAESIDVNLQPEEIDICHWLNKGKDKPRPIIVRFLS